MQIEEKYLNSESFKEIRMKCRDFKWKVSEEVYRHCLFQHLSQLDSFLISVKNRIYKKKFRGTIKSGSILTAFELDPSLFDIILSTRFRTSRILLLKIIVSTSQTSLCRSKCPEMELVQRDRVYCHSHKAESVDVLKMPTTTTSNWIWSCQIQFVFYGLI